MRPLVMRRSQPTLFALVMTFMMGSSALAQSIPKVVVPKRSFTETYFERRNLSAYAKLVGWQGGELGGQLRDPTVYVAGLKPGDRTLCVTMRHVDGSYLGSARINNPNRGSRIVLQLPSTLVQRRSQIGEADVALMAQVSRGSRCTDSDPILSANWGSGPAKGATSLFVSASLGSDVRLMIAGASRSTRCEALEELLPDPRKNRQQFNTVCRIELPRACQSETAFELIVDSGSGRGPPMPGRLRRDCA